MARAKRVYAGLYCSETGMLLQSRRLTKGKTVKDYAGYKVYSPRANKRVEVKAKQLKKGN